MTPLKLIFIGTPDFGLPALEQLAQDQRFDIVAVITQPDKKVGRQQLLSQPPIKKRALELDLPVFQPIKISDFKSELAALSPDLVVVIAYAQIIPADILSIPRFGFVNLHGSLLPRYRGAACIQASLAGGDNETGVTIMQMDKGLDTGPILSQKAVPIAPTDTAESLFDKLSELGAEILVPTLLDFVAHKLQPRAQDDQVATYVGMLKKSDGRIDWQKPATEIERFVRAMYPWPGAFTEINKRGVPPQIVKILVSAYLPTKNEKLQIGELYQQEGELCVKCGQGALVLKRLQLAGKKPITGADFLRGYESLLGERFQ